MDDSDEVLDLGIGKLKSDVYKGEIQSYLQGLPEQFRHDDVSTFLAVTHVIHEYYNFPEAVPLRGFTRLSRVSTLCKEHGIKTAALRDLENRILSSCNHEATAERVHISKEYDMHIQQFCPRCLAKRMETVVKRETYAMHLPEDDDRPADEVMVFPLVKLFFNQAGFALERHGLKECIESVLATSHPGLTLYDTLPVPDIVYIIRECTRQRYFPFFFQTHAIKKTIEHFRQSGLLGNLAPVERDIIKIKRCKEHDYTWTTVTNVFGRTCGVKKCKDCPTTISDKSLVRNNYDPWAFLRGIARGKHVSPETLEEAKHYHEIAFNSALDGSRFKNHEFVSTLSLFHALMKDKGKTQRDFDAFGITQGQYHGFLRVIQGKEEPEARAGVEEGIVERALAIAGDIVGIELVEKTCKWFHNRYRHLLDHKQRTTQVGIIAYFMARLYLGPATTFKSVGKPLGRPAASIYNSLNRFLKALNIDTSGGIDSLRFSEHFPWFEKFRAHYSLKIDGD